MPEEENPQTEERKSRENLKKVNKGSIFSSFLLFFLTSFFLFLLSFFLTISHTEKV
jgi:cell division septal protein FtsQ